MCSITDHVAEGILKYSLIPYAQSHDIEVKKLIEDIYSYYKNINVNVNTNANVNANTKTETDTNKAKNVKITPKRVDLKVQKTKKKMTLSF